MSVLGREDIIREIMKEHLLLDPFDINEPEHQQRLQPSSIDLRVGGEYGRFTRNDGLVNDMAPRRLTEITERNYERFRIGENEGFVVAPGELVLVAVDLAIWLPSNIAARIDGKSTIGRSGIDAQNAGWVEPGFHGVLTCEVRNDAPWPIEIRGGDDIAQLVLMRLETPTDFPYGNEGLLNRYQGQRGVTFPRQRTQYGWGR
jgi:dCTP deaminase